MSEEKNEIKIKDNIQSSEYANSIKIGRTKSDEFNFVFMTVFGQGDDRNGKVTSKVTVNRTTFERMTAIMNQMKDKISEAEKHEEEEKKEKQIKN